MATQKTNSAAVNPSTDSFRLTHHAVERAKRIKPPERKNWKRKRENTGFGIIAVNILAALASYARDATMACWPSVPAIARDTGYSEQTISYVLAQFERVGIFTRRERWKQSTVYAWIRSDASSGYTILNRKWWTKHADLGEGRGLFVILHAAADGKPLTMKVNKECLAKLGMSRAKLYRLLPALKTNGMVATEILKDATQFRVTVSHSVRFITPEVSQRADEVSQRAAEVSQSAVSGVSTSSVKGKPSQKQVFDFEVKAHQGEVPPAKTRERPASHFPNFRTESKSLAIASTMTGPLLAECYRQCYQEQFGVPCPWDDGDQAAAARTVGRLAGWGPDEYERVFENLFASKDGYCTRKPSFALKHVSDYIGGPLNGYHRPLLWKDLTPSERLAVANGDGYFAYFDAAAERREERKRANGGRETGAFHRDEVRDYAAGADEVFTEVCRETPKPEPAQPEQIEATVAVVDFCPSPFQVKIRVADDAAAEPIFCWCADKKLQVMLMAARQGKTLVHLVYRNDGANKLIVSVAPTEKESSQSPCEGQGVSIDQLLRKWNQEENAKRRAQPVASPIHPFQPPSGQAAQGKI